MQFFLISTALTDLAFFNFDKNINWYNSHFNFDKKKPQPVPKSSTSLFFIK